jgi:hypothetical protein
MSNSGVRDYIPNRAFGNGISGDGDLALVSLADAADATFTPVPNAIHSMVPTAGRSLTLTQADALKTTLRVGAGFVFYIKNDSAGANSITLVAGGGANVETQGTSTLVIAQGETGKYCLYRSSATVHTLIGLGIATH